ncbi:putative ribonuclease H-like domain-containing protein [Tanacetum coccineum]
MAEHDTPPPTITAMKILSSRSCQSESGRVKSILLLAIPDEYLLKFHNVPDAKSLWKAIKSRFGGNEESKKIQKNVLKHQFENFTTAPNKSLDKAYDRFQKLISQLEVYAAPVSKEDINQKFLRSLPPSWSQIALNFEKMKPDISNRLILMISITTLGTNNVSTASGNFRVNTAVGTNSLCQVSSTPGVDEVVCSFFAQQTTSPLLDNEDLQQINQDDLEELDIRWQVAMLTVRVQGFIKKTRRNLDFKGKQPVTFDKLSDEESTPTNDRFSKADGYHVVPPPITGNFLTPRADISFAGLDEYAIRKKIIESKTTELNADTSKSKTSETVGNTNEVNVEKPKSVNESVVSTPNINKDKVIIEDWNSDDENDVSEVSPVKTNETQTAKTQVDKIGQTSKKAGIGFKKIKACFVCKSTDHLIKDCDFYDKKSPEPKLKNVVNTGQRVVKPVWDNAKRVNHQKISNKLNYPQARRTFVPSGVLTRTGLVNPVRPNEKRAVQTINTARSVCTARSVSTARPFAPKITQTSSAVRPIYPRMDNVRPRASSSQIKRSYYTKLAFRPKNLKQDVKTSGVKNMTTAGTQVVVNTGKGKMNNDLKKSRWVWRPKGNYMDHESKEKGSFLLKKFEYADPKGISKSMDHAVVDSGCSSHMTDNKAYLSDYEDYNGGFMAFGSDPKGGKITGKGKTRTANLDFDDVYFVDELNFKLLDENQVVLRAPRQNGVYSLDLKNIVPSVGITCLYLNATTDESKLWHRRLGHVNFKNINKLVKGHLVRSLPSKVFVNDHTCVAYKKSKQHKASCKAKLERTIRKPLELLHMDLFGPVLVESINKKKYCLVVTDDFSRFSWVFFLATKVETAEILCKFIIGLENQLNHKVKIIRCDHGTEFKNHAMNELCAKKRIKREFCMARTPQQNGVAERKNRTLIEAARTMLTDSLLPISF